RHVADKALHLRGEILCRSCPLPPGEAERGGSFRRDPPNRSGTHLSRGLSSAARTQELETPFARYASRSTGRVGASKSRGGPGERRVSHRASQRNSSSSLPKPSRALRVRGCG